ncbi:hypothetical protein [Paracoccus onubensis]|nr:hypothetical protein [Paracoccus onubensis]
MQRAYFPRQAAVRLCRAVISLFLIAGLLFLAALQFENGSSRLSVIDAERSSVHFYAPSETVFRAADHRNEPKSHDSPPVELVRNAETPFPDQYSPVEWTPCNRPECGRSYFRPVSRAPPVA